MRTLLLTACSVLALLLAACSTPPPVSLQAAASVPQRIVMVATLATNACEEATAALQTRAIVGTIQASRALREGRITVEQAQAVVDNARDAQSAARAACATGKLDVTELNRAAAAVVRIAVTLGDTK